MPEDVVFPANKVFFHGCWVYPFVSGGCGRVFFFGKIVRKFYLYAPFYKIILYAGYYSFAYTGNTAI